MAKTKKAIQQATEVAEQENVNDTSSVSATGKTPKPIAYKVVQSFVDKDNWSIVYEEGQLIEPNDSFTEERMADLLQRELIKKA